MLTITKAAPVVRTASAIQADAAGGACACAHLYATHHGAVLFVVQRAFDGWLAFDLAGTTTDTIGGEFEVTRGGARFQDRIFALHANLGEVRAGRALAIAGGRDAFAFGGDLLALVRRTRAEGRPRLRLLRGATVLDARGAGRGQLQLGRGVSATHALVFDTAPALLPLAIGARVEPNLGPAREPVLRPVSCANAARARPTSRSDSGPDRGAAQDNVRGRTRSSGGGA